MKKDIMCPFCEKYVFDEENDFAICDICGWENDGVQWHDHNFSGGANSLSVNEEKIYYKLSLYEEKEIELKTIREEYNDKRKKIFSKYAGVNYCIDGNKIYEELSKARHEFVRKMNVLGSTCIGGDMP